jgi:hypothetical protein
MWQTIDTAPDNRLIELSVIEHDEVHALTFPCRRTGLGWTNAVTHEQVFVRPTHWQDWGANHCERDLPARCTLSLSPRQKADAPVDAAAPIIVGGPAGSR